MTDYIVRQAVDQDKDLVLSWRNHDEVRAVMLSSHFITQDEHDAWWTSTMHRKDREVLIAEKGDIPIGVITIYGYEGPGKSAWWGFYIDNASVSSNTEKISVWLAIEQLAIEYAKDTLKVSELFCESLKSNEVVLSIHERVGFVECSAPPDSTESHKDVKYMKMSFPQNSQANSRRMYFLSSYNTDFITSVFRDALQKYPVLSCSLSQIAFGQYRQALHDETHDINDRQDDIFVFCERIEDLLGDFYSIAALKSVAQMEAVVDEYMQLIAKAVSSHTERQVFVLDFFFHKPFPFSLEETSDTSKPYLAIDTINRKLLSFCEPIGVSVISFRHVLSLCGVSSAYGNKYWYMARSPFSYEFMEALSNHIIGVMLAARSQSARVLVLDLDNTLWKGVIGDDGIEEIQLGGDYPGNIYRDLQFLFKSLSDRGFLLCVCSKNTESVALEAIEKHPAMLLKEPDFVTTRINWDEKADNIRSIAEELNIGLRSFCFIDDNPVERQAVRENIPGIFVPELPEDPSDWYQFISQLPELTLNAIGASDKKRVELYKQRAMLAGQEKKYTDKKSFLRSLEIELLIKELDDDGFYRVHQLFNKTNQFNTCTIRYTRTQLNTFREAADAHVFYVMSRDKYTNELEGIASLVIKEQKSSWLIENFVMSCRVMGRCLEDAIINTLSVKAASRGIHTLEGAFVPSDRNMPVSGLYEKLGFTFDEKSGIWKKDVSKAKFEDFGIKILEDHAIR